MYFVDRNYENPTFQLWQSKKLPYIQSEYMQNNVCSDIFFIWGHAFTCFCNKKRSSTHLFAYSYRIISYLLKITKIQHFISSLFFIRHISNFHCSIWNVVPFLLHKLKLGPDFPFHNIILLKANVRQIKSRDQSVRIFVIILLFIIWKVLYLKRDTLTLSGNVLIYIDLCSNHDIYKTIFPHNISLTNFYTSHNTRYQ